MDYRVMIVTDDALPSDVRRVMVEKRGQPPVLVIAESAAGNWRFLQDWARLHEGDDSGVEPGGYFLRAV